MVRQSRIALALAVALGLMINPVHGDVCAQPAQGPAGNSQDTTGSLLFEPMPTSVSNPAGADHFWRFRRYPSDGTLPLDDFHVVLMASSAKKTPPRSGEIRVSGYRTRPGTIAVSPGSQLTFISDGPVPYTLEVVGRAMEAVKLDGPGSTKSVTLEKPGRYVFQDPISTSARTWVVVGSVVADSALSQISSQEASFNFGAVPPGQYRLRAYFRGEIIPTLEREVTVAVGGALAPAKVLLSTSDLANLIE
jgi:plastocyanin